jgi:SAM-dependent methyltransferase
MFFPQRITGIREGDRVLEIGPGADPHPRSDVLLEMAFDDPAEYVKQFGHDRPLETRKELVFYDGITFPFPDKSFDYVICSHVLEHVPDVEHFLSEIFRVARRGYFEYPLCYYELVYNIGAHLNYVKFTGGTLHYLKKADTPIDVFKPVQEFYHASLSKGYTRTVDDMIEQIMEGFEWDAPFPAKRVHDLRAVCHATIDLPMRTDRQLYTYGPRRLLKELLRSMRLRGTY